MTKSKLLFMRTIIFIDWQQNSIIIASSIILLNILQLVRHQQWYNKIMNDLKITFPKLKALSERNTVKTLKIISNTVKTGVDNRSQRTEMTPLEEKLNAIKYHYVNKSPHYFKARNRSVQEYQPIKEVSQTIEEYVGQHSRIVSKEMLLSLARERLKRQRRHQYNKNKISNEFQRTRLTKRSEEEQIKFSKYQNFRPLRIPLKSSIKYSLYHPEPTAKRTID